ncbi:CoB--CoM heterodisulfide reductase iron-sulfur subunit B family protein [Desulfotomaculum copahuensis]|uniref:Heterodisulfide reductase subunit B n=1 Tax=Desulfotomaculum copahuensis TaxID=1838280 RepID=A0A1B7LG72_9FIRM|nr:CoB--CoM heterodisulfide reductase iron-sulfur subunit B family protein [Desulfotomaculum copahuensis]OAT84835.1 heterodisulfide reductase subunit B [Desulfotomaculum copahuensis]
MQLAYYPGCSWETSGREYDLSARLAGGKLGLEFIEIKDWNCCGSSAGHSTSRLLATALAARNLALAEKMGLDLTAPCASCYQRLALARHDLLADGQLRKQVNRITGHTFHGNMRVRSILEVVASLGGEHIAARVVKPLRNLKVAAYYGCLLVRPRAVQVDDPENPQMMEKIMAVAGAEVLAWSHKTECCGTSLAMNNDQLALPLVAGILEAASLSGADCIVCACPLCHFNLDYRQKKVNRVLGTGYQLPVFYFTQLLGVALGLEPGRLGLFDHFVNTKPVLQLVS